MLEFSSTESCSTGATSTPLVGFSSNDSSCDGNVALMNDFESTSGCSGQGPQGPDGFSAYQIAVFDGFVGTEEEWLASLVGPGVPIGGTAGQILAKINSTDYNTQWINNTDLVGLTSVGISLPTGLTVSNSPLVANGVLNVAYQSGYSIPTTASQTNWDTAYTNRISSLTTIGSNGSATLISKVLNIPTYTLSGLGGVATTTTITTTIPLTGGGDLSVNRILSIDLATSIQSGYLSSTDWNTFNSKFNLPSLTSGSVLFSDGTTVAQNNANFFWNNANNRLGIGTTTPSYALHVNGVTGSTTFTIPSYNSQLNQNYLMLYGGYGAGMQGTYNNPTGGDLTFGTFINSIFNEKMRLLPSGNFGIGTVSPSHKLELSSAGYTSLGIFSGANNIAEIVFQNTAYGLPRWTIRSSATPNGSSGSLTFQRLASTFPFTITNNDNVLIGTIVDNGGKLQIKAGGSAGTDIALRVRNSGDTGDLITIDGTGKLNFSTPTANTVSIQGSGNGDFFINSTAYGPMISSSGSNYTFNQWGTNVNFIVGTGGAPDRLGYNMTFKAGISTGNTNGGDFQFFSSGSGTAGSSALNTVTEVLRIKYNGNVGIGTTTPTSIFQVKTTTANTNGSICFTNNSASTIASITDTGSALTMLQFRASSYNFTDCSGLRIASTGYANTPSAMLHVKGDGTNTIAIFETSAGALALSVNNSGSGFGFGSGGINLITTNDGTTNVNTGTGLIYKANVSTSNTTIYSHYFSNNNIRQAISGTIGLVDYNSSFSEGAGSANFRPLNIGYTLNNTGAQTGTATGIFLNATETALNGMGHNLMDLQVGGVSKFKVGNTGLTTISTGAVIGGSTVVGYAGTMIYYSTQGSGTLKYSASGVWAFQDVFLLQIGGTTSSFPAIKRNGSAIDFRLADDSGFSTISAGGGNFSGSLSATQGTGLLSGTVNAVSSVLNIVPAAGSANFRLFNTTYTINASGAQTGNTTGYFLNATETNLNGMVHNLMDLQVGSVSKFKIASTGDVTIGGITLGSNSTVYALNIAASNFTTTSNNATLTLNPRIFDGSPGNARTAVAVTPTTISHSSGLWNTFVINSTYTQSGTASSTDLLINRTETSIGSGTQLLLDAQVGGVSKFSVGRTGVLSALSLTFTGIIQDSNNGTNIDFPSNGVITFFSNGSTDFNRIQLGGTTNLFPAIKRNGTIVDFRLADDSGYSAINTNKLYMSGQEAITEGSGMWYSSSHPTRYSSFTIGSGQTTVTAMGARLHVSGSWTFADTVEVSSAVVAITSTTKGFLPPRMTTAQKVGIATPATGLVVFDTDLGKLCVFATTWQTITSV